MINQKPIANQPEQDDWLNMSLQGQSYWLLKFIDHYRDVVDLRPISRLDQDYQRETMLINVPNYDRSDSEVIAVVSHCTNWLLQNSFLMDYPSQANGIYKATQKGIDLMDLTRKDEEPITNLISFAVNSGSLQSYEAKPINVLGLLVRRMEKTGKTNEASQITIDNRLAINLSRGNNRRVTLESLRSATNVCKSRKWLSQRYVSSGPYEQLHLTDSGLSYYDQNKNDDGIDRGEPIPELVTNAAGELLGSDVKAADPLVAENNIQLIKTNVGLQQSIVYTAKMLLEPLDSFRERIRSDNKLSAEKPEVRDDILKFIDQLVEHMQFLIDRMPLDVGEEYNDEIEETASWAKETYVKTVEEFGHYFSPDSVSQIIAPTTITLGLGVVGSVFGGPAGFAAGTLVGNVVTRSVKPKELSDRVSENIEDEGA